MDGFMSGGWAWMLKGILAWVGFLFLLGVMKCQVVAWRETKVLRDIYPWRYNFRVLTTMYLSGLTHQLHGWIWGINVWSEYRITREDNGVDEIKAYRLVEVSNEQSARDRAMQEADARIDK